MCFDQNSSSKLQNIQQELKDTQDELNLVKDINISQEETIKQLQAQTSDSESQYLALLALLLIPFGIV